MTVREHIGAVVVDRAGDGSIQARYKTVPSPDFGPTQLLVRPEFIGLCGSDLEQLRGHVPDSLSPQFPHVLGHEWSGHIEAVGTDVTRFRKGDAVTGHGALGSNRWFGVTHDGAMADRFVIDESLCFGVPTGMSMRTAAILEPFVCVYTGLNKIGGISPADIVHVYGLGAIGLTAVIQACNLGARVVAWDPSPTRRERALICGADVVLDPIHLSALSQSAWFGEADVVIEASGSAAAQTNALESAGVDGRVLMLGVSQVRPTAARMSLIQERNLLVTGSTGAPPESWQPAIGYALSAGVNLDPLVTSEFSFDEIETAVQRAMDPVTEVKVLLHPRR